MKTVSRVLLAVVVVAGVLLSLTGGSPAAADSRCTATPNHNLEDARDNFEAECGRTWDPFLPDTCDYKSDGFHCHGLIDRPGTPVVTHSTRSGIEVSIRWNSVPGAAGYDIYRDGQYIATNPAEDTDFWEQGESPRAYYNIVAFDGSGNYSERSGPVWPLGRLFLFATAADGANQFQLGWNNHGESTHLPVTYSVYSVRSPGSGESLVAENMTDTQLRVFAVPGERFIVRAYVPGYAPVESAPFIPLSDWYPLRPHDDAEAEIRGRLSGDYLSDDAKERIVKVAASALGDRPDLIEKWLGDTGGEVHDVDTSIASGLVTCFNSSDYTKLQLPDTASDRTVVHELVHVIDCSRSVGGVRTTDGIGAGMSSADQATLAAERARLFDLHNGGNRPGWLREYTFTNRTEFFADVSSYFLVVEWRRTQMALEAPALYDMLRSYYNKTHWAASAYIG